MAPEAPAPSAMHATAAKATLGSMGPGARASPTMAVHPGMPQLLVPNILLQLFQCLDLSVFMI